MELSPQTHRLVVTSGKTVAFIPALPSGNLQTHSLQLPYAPSSASIHPILQDRFVTGSLTDEWVRVHGINGEERDVLKGHHGPVHCVEYSPDGEMYASGSGTLCSFVHQQRLVLIIFDVTTVLVSHRGWHDPTVANDSRQIVRSLARTKRRLIQTPPISKVHFSSLYINTQPPEHHSFLTRLGNLQSQPSILSRCGFVYRKVTTYTCSSPKPQCLPLIKPCGQNPRMARPAPR